MVALDTAGRIFIPRSPEIETRQPAQVVTSIKTMLGSSERVRLGRQRFLPEELASMILRALREDAEVYLGQAVERAVISVPAYAGEAQRAATREAAQQAGFREVRMLSESVAAALAHSVNQGGEAHLLVYHLGGGSFDASVIRMADRTFEVLCTEGNEHLGGDDFDQRIIDYILGYLRHMGIPIPFTLTRRQQDKLKDLAEEMKKELSYKIESAILIPGLGWSTQGQSDLKVTLLRHQFEDLIRDLIITTIGLTHKAIVGAGLTPSEIDSILLVGGSTNIPLVRLALREAFGVELLPSREEAVALGTAIYTAIMPKEAGAWSPTVKPIEIQKAAAKREMERGNYAHAIADLESILQIAPSDSEAREMLVSACLAQGKQLASHGQRRKAITVLRQGLKWDTNNEQIEALLCTLHRTKASREAKKRSRKAKRRKRKRKKRR